jgi:hypothetical protein
MAVARKTTAGGGSGSDSSLLENITCNAAVAVGDWVRIDGSNVAQKAQGDSIANSLVVGVVQSKPSSTLCNIVTDGGTTAIFSSLDPTKAYFLSPSTAGAMTVTVPSGAGQVILKLGSPLSADKFIVRIGERYALA